MVFEKRVSNVSFPSFQPPWSPRSMSTTGASVTFGWSKASSRSACFFAASRKMTTFQGCRLKLEGDMAASSMIRRNVASSTSLSGSKKLIARLLVRISLNSITFSLVQIVRIVIRIKVQCKHAGWNCPYCFRCGPYDYTASSVFGHCGCSFKLGACDSHGVPQSCSVWTPQEGPVVGHLCKIEGSRESPEALSEAIKKNYAAQVE